MKNYAILILILTTLLISVFIQIITIHNINNRFDRINVEYQFIVTDNTITVYDKNNVIGTVKLEGQLDSLLIDYNQ
jgi:hypothetical protein